VERAVNRVEVARVLEYMPGRCVGFAAHSTIALIDNPDVVTVPGAAGHCVGLFEWEGLEVPLIDLGQLLHGAAGRNEGDGAHVLVLAWQPSAGPAAYGAVRAPRLIHFAQAHDSLQCDLPQDSERWGVLAVSCFSNSGVPVPIIDTGALFGTPINSPQEEK
jgi:hypothetical protein